MEFGTRFGYDGLVMKMSSVEQAMEAMRFMERGKPYALRAEDSKRKLAAELRALCCELGIRPVVIGGLAVSHHGYARFTADVDILLTREEAASLYRRLKSEPGWKRFLHQYRTYMQLILVGAAIVSLAIQEWSTGVLLILISVVNAVVGLRQEGKAESAMNALKAMVTATARVRRDGSEAEIPQEEVVVGDVVLLAAGDDVSADGRIIEASSLQIDESALTGESVPA